MLGRMLAVMIATSLAQPPAESTQSPALEQARALHQKAQARYDTADYRGAIEAWTEAYEALPNNEQSAMMKPFILYNIASARERAYDVKEDVSQLKQAKILLETFERAIPQIYTDEREAAAELQKVRERIATLEGRIAEHGRDDEPEASAKPELPTEPEPEALVEPEPPTELDPVVKDEPGSSHRGYTIGGAVAVGLGAAMGGVAIGGAVMGRNANELNPQLETDLQAREQHFARGKVGNGMLIAGAVAAPLLVGAGVALIVIGARKSKGARTSFVPSLGPRGASLSLTTRF